MEQKKVWIIGKHLTTYLSSIKIKFPLVQGLANALGFLLPQANGRTSVDCGCTHLIDGLFWSLPIYLLGFFSKYER